jgi:hypothetical protein
VNPSSARAGLLLSARVGLDIDERLGYLSWLKWHKVGLSGKGDIGEYLLIRLVSLLIHLQVDRELTSASALVENDLWMALGKPDTWLINKLPYTIVCLMWTCGTHLALTLRPCIVYPRFTPKSHGVEAIFLGLPHDMPLCAVIPDDLRKGDWTDNLLSSKLRVCVRDTVTIHPSRFDRALIRLKAASDALFSAPLEYIS